MYSLPCDGDSHPRKQKLPHHPNSSFVQTQAFLHRTLQRLELNQRLSEHDQLFYLLQPANLLGVQIETDLGQGKSCPSQLSHVPNSTHFDPDPSKVQLHYLQDH